MATDSIAGVLSFEDPFEEITNMDQYWSFFAENPTLDQPETPSDPNPVNYPDLKPGRELMNNFGMDDPVVWDYCTWKDKDVKGKLSESGGVGFEGETSNNGGNGNCNGLQNSVYGVFSVQPNCSCCQRLRVIIHTNGMNMKRLEIHGILGTITHAVLETYDSSFQSQGFQMFDFHKESTQVVKSFLTNYFEMCKQEGYSLLQDPLSTFYEALCVGLNPSVNHEDFIKLSFEIAGESKFGLLISL
ncbi:hypothetical protein CDL12_23172 [Handroanthus impetiginosus]|uniref:Uncharacterized protein n=1 Tax=Handroanthus impetiginosus TaxID=429701 RepID=A0A2G9GG80_9LAMI|nr:hypothetical protein CDL12_23172 [Handroanthus impetiginosus]